MKIQQVLLCLAIAGGLFGCSSGEVEEVKTNPTPAAKPDDKANDMAPKLEINPDYVPPVKK